MRYLTFAAMLGSAVVSLGGDWPRFLGPEGSGTSQETGLITQWPATGLSKLWDAPLGESYGPPSVAGGKLFHFDIVRGMAVLTVRDAATGQQLWQYEYASNYVDQYGYDGTRCCPVIDDGRVYVYGPEGQLHCVSIESRKKLWSVDTVKTFNVHPNFFGVSSVPVIEGKRLIVAVGGSPKGEAVAMAVDKKPGTSAIVAFDKATGAVEYAAGAELASNASPMIATIAGERVGLYFARGGLLAFDPATGATRAHFPWRAKMLESVNAANPVVIGDRIFISESYELGSAMLKFTGKSFETVWTDRDRDRDDKALLAHFATPIAIDGYLYGCSNRHSPDAELRCLDAKSGEVVWRERKTRWHTLLHVDAHMLSLHETGELRLWVPDPKAYREVARWTSPDLEMPCWAPPVLADGRLYVRGKDKLVCYGLMKP
jgi:outer membrane protein assembly factor BamB